jgi:hypothetical protein
MPKSLNTSLRRLITVASIAACALLVGPTNAGAASVVNGDFETGNLSGWQGNDVGFGTWVAYSDSAIQLPESPPLTVPPVPQGSFAAITGQMNISRAILFQDVVLEPNYTHQLTLTAYYFSRAAIVAANTLSPDGEGEGSENQQYRIDVMRPTAPLDSVSPLDILAAVFATKTGDPEEMGPTQYSVDLTPFAGQTVRLRMAVVVNQGGLNGGVDSVFITSTPPSNAITLGKPKLNKKKGTAKLPVTVPGPGTLALTGKGVVRQNKTSTGKATIKLLVRAKGKKKKSLERTGKAKVKVTVMFTPTGGSPNNQSLKLVLKKRLH